MVNGCPGLMLSLRNERFPFICQLMAVLKSVFFFLFLIFPHFGVEKQGVENTHPVWSFEREEFPVNHGMQ